MKTVSLISFLFSLSTFAATDLYPRYECGLYRAKGALSLNRQNQFIFTLRRGSYSPMEFVLLGGGAKEKLSGLSSAVELEFYVPKPFETPARSFIIFKGFTHQGVEKDEAKLISKMDCGKEFPGKP